MGLTERFTRWKGALTPLEEICFDMSILITVWMLSGVAFYYFCDEHWDATYSWFFAVNVGLGVGYGKYMLTENSTKYFTVVFCMVGTSLIMGGLVCFFDLLTQRTKAASFTATRYVTFCGDRLRIAQDDLKLGIFAIGYIVMIGVGIAIGFVYEDYDNFADALMFAVTNYTTSGLLTPRMSRGSLISTTVSLLIGIPLNALFWGDLATKYYASVQAKQSAEEDELRSTIAVDEDEEEVAAPPASAGTAGGDEPAQPRLKGASGGGDYVAFLQRELVISGLVTNKHLDSIKTKYKSKVREQQQQQRDDAA